MRNFLKSRLHQSLDRTTSNRTVTWSYSHVSMLNVQQNLHIKGNLTLQEIIETLQIHNENKNHKKQGKSTANTHLLLWYLCLLPELRNKNAYSFVPSPVEAEMMPLMFPSFVECLFDWLASFCLHKTWWFLRSCSETQYLSKLCLNILPTVILIIFVIQWGILEITIEYELLICLILCPGNNIRSFLVKTCLAFLLYAA